MGAMARPPDSSGALRGDERLTSDEVTAVLRRAVEIDATDDAPGDEGIDLHALESAAAEVGVSAIAVRQAYAELRAGAPPDTGPKPAHSRAWPRRVSEQRLVAFPPEVVRDRVRLFLKEQMFELRRSTPEYSSWRKRTDLAASIRRGTDLTKRIKLREVETISVYLRPVDDGYHTLSTLLRMDASLDHRYRQARAGAIAGTAAGAVNAGLVFSALAGPPGVELSTALIGGVGGVALGIPFAHKAGRRWLGFRHENVADLLASFIDTLAYPTDAC